MATIHAHSKETACFSKAGLAIGSTASGISIAAPNGAGVDYAIAGIAYHKADAATAAITAAVAQLADTTCAYLVQLDAAGAVSTVRGEEVANSLIGDGTTTGRYAVQIPSVEEDKCPIGALIVTTTAVTFTAGTTDLDASGVETDYVDYAGGIGGPELHQSVA